MADAKIMTFGELFSATTDVIPDNKAAAVEIEGLDGNDYIKIDTTDGEEWVKLVSSGVGKVGIGVLVDDYDPDAENPPPYPFVVHDDLPEAGENLVLGEFRATGNAHGVIAVRSDGTDKDPKIWFQVGAGTYWCMGADDDETGNFKIAKGHNFAPGDKDRFVIDYNSDVVTIPGGEFHVTGGDVGVGTTEPTSLLHISEVGSIGSTTSMLTIENRANSASMVETGTAIEFKQYYYSGTPATRAAGRVQVVAEDSWSGLGSTWDSYMSFQTAKNGTVDHKMRINSNGDVGIGTTGPTAKLHVKVTDDSSQWLAKIEADGSTQNALNLVVDGTVGTGARFDLGTTTHAWLNNGKVGFGNDSPTKNLSIVNPDGEVQLELRSDAETSNAVFYLGTPFDTSAVNKTAIIAKANVGYSQSDLHFCLNNTDDNTTEVSVSDSKMMIDTDGNVGIAMTPGGSHKIDVTGSAGLSTGTAWTNTSDSRVKKNIESIDNALEKIEALRPVSFEYTEDYIDCTDGLIAGQRYNSFIAQEYAQVFPNAVSNRGDVVKDLPNGDSRLVLQDVQQFTPHDLNMYLVRAVQELSAQVKALKEGN